MEDQAASANTSRRSGLRATKRIDYSTLEGGSLEEEEQAKRATKESVLVESKPKKTPAKKRRLSTELSSPSMRGDDDGDWDDDEDAAKPRRTATPAFPNAKKPTAEPPQGTLPILFYVFRIFSLLSSLLLHPVWIPTEICRIIIDCIPPSSPFSYPSSSSHLFATPPPPPSPFPLLSPFSSFFPLLFSSPPLSSFKHHLNTIAGSKKGGRPTMRVKVTRSQSMNDALSSWDPSGTSTTPSSLEGEGITPTRTSSRTRAFPNYNEVFSDQPDTSPRALIYWCLQNESLDAGYEGESDDEGTVDDSMGGYEDEEFAEPKVYDDGDYMEVDNSAQDDSGTYPYGETKVHNSNLQILVLA